MKYTILITFCVCAFTLASCFHRHHDIRISVTETGDVYRFTATYPENKARKVARIINRSIKPGSNFDLTDNYVDVSTILEDKTQFSIKASPGNLRIQLDRDENSDASYHRIKDMCEEIKNTLKD